ncbi:Pyridinium-3,5-bisthiocarboxylic acid mononucleotide nickel insertion protein [Thermoflexales bacterium]|nr:Pyridinium-3,5-bisthiocarboxylic acid mononucleotide nickel insertion protein [Thermoflexales bacterium]
MRIAYIDCVGGASGDMLLSALVDAGAAEERVRAIPAALHLPDCAVTFERVMRGALAALQARVSTPHNEAHRHVPELLEIIDRAEISERVKQQARSVIQRLAEAEARIHHSPIESVHLHEVGGDDALIDIVGVLAALENLQIEQVYVSPVPLARGWTKSLHGNLPLPAPATLALLEGMPIRYVDEVEQELVTPTGAVLLKSLAHEFGGFPAMTLGRVGVGAGRRELPFPNIVRVWLGETLTRNAGLIVETLTVLETNIDDLNPQVYEHVLNRLLAAGALDVTLTPMQMKKNRPAIQLAVLCRPNEADALLPIIFTETPTLGVRRSTVERVSVPRSIEPVATRFGSIRVKVARWNDRVQAVPEYEDCKRAAEASGAALIDVLQAAQAAWHAGRSA